VKVLDKKTNEPLRVLVETEGLLSEIRTTDPATGKCVFDDLLPGTLCVSVSKDAYYSTFHDFRISDTQIERVILMQQLDSKHIVPKSGESMLLSGDTLGIIYGKITDVRGGFGLRAKVSYQGKRKGVVNTDAEGFFEIIGLSAGEYRLSIEHPAREYLPVKSIIVPVGVGDKIAVNTQLENIVSIYGFKRGGISIPKHLLPKLDEIGSFMKENPYTYIEVAGYADPELLNSKKYPTYQALSQARAEVVKNYLVKKFAIGSERILVRAFGPEGFAAEYTTKEKLAAARKVKITLLGISFLPISGIIDVGE